MTSIYERLKNLQITLHGVPPCGGWLRCCFRSVCPDRQSDSFVGAARSVAIELLATLQAAIGDLNDVRRIVKLLVFANSGSHFTEHHVVANGASELFIEVFEERGAHARSAVGVSQIPFGCYVEIEMVVEAFVSESACEL